MTHLSGVNEPATLAAARLRARSAAYSAIAATDLAESLQLLMIAILRVATGGDASLLDRHLDRLAPLRAAQGMTARDIEAAFAEITSALRDVVAAGQGPPWQTVRSVVDQTQLRALELLDGQ